MSEQGYDTIGEQDLVQRLAEAKPDNIDPDDGFALVNVLEPEQYRKEHIPQSINIPLSSIARAKERFAEDKELIVYCASPSCDASPKAAQALVDMGFSHVHDYAGGLSDWKRAGHKAVGSTA